jgi:hypothetical protein
MSVILIVVIGASIDAVVGCWWRAAAQESYEVLA